MCLLNMKRQIVLLWVLIVSILVLVDVPLECSVALSKWIEVIVSILVLVDVPLEYGNCVLTRLITDGFNPCFSGCAS